MAHGFYINSLDGLVDVTSNSYVTGMNLYNNSFSTGASGTSGSVNIATGLIPSGMTLLFVLSNDSEGYSVNAPLVSYNNSTGVLSYNYYDTYRPPGVRSISYNIYGTF